MSSRKICNISLFTHIESLKGNIKMLRLTEKLRKINNARRRTFTTQSTGILSMILLSTWRLSGKWMNYAILSIMEDRIKNSPSERNEPVRASSISCKLIVSLRRSQMCKRMISLASRLLPGSNYQTAYILARYPSVRPSKRPFRNEPELVAKNNNDENSGQCENCSSATVLA